MNRPALVLAALALEAAIGYGDRLHARIPHPVVWIGNALSFLERHWNRPQYPRRLLGIISVLVVAGGAGAAGFLVQHILLAIFPAGGWLVALVATVGLAQHSLYVHIRAVLKPLQSGDLGTARLAVGRVVGRDVQALDEAGIAAAALESLAESFNDGVVAPALWLLVGGLPGLFAYKAVNTADSIVGHREPRWKAFGWAAARTDDVMNLLPARLAGALIAIAGRGGWRVMLADAPKHASPNAGWPEAAMAGALNVQLGGPATYDGVIHSRPVFGRGAQSAANDLDRGLRLYVAACALLWLGLGLGALSWLR